MNKPLNMKNASTQYKNQDKKNLPKDLENMISEFFQSKYLSRNDSKLGEFELRFGINTELATPISKIDYDNTVQFIKSQDFTTKTPGGIHNLRIIPEMVEPVSGFTKTSTANGRVEIYGLDLIQQYCRTNNLQKMIDASTTYSDERQIRITKKTTAMSAAGSIIKPVDFSDFNFRASYQIEEDISLRSSTATELVKNWTTTRKIFRYMNRVRFSHDTMPIHIDLSILKGNRTSGGNPISEFTLQDANVFNNDATYEIEIELDNNNIGKGTDYDTADKVHEVVKKSIRLMLSALQRTHYPVSYVERDNILRDYMKIIHGDHYEHKHKDVQNKDFIGPSSVTLMHENVSLSTVNTNIPNIRTNYTVTDKADGERRLLFVSDTGKIYMISSNMEVIFTGTRTLDKELYNSILDGEHIMYDKNKVYLNLYAAFDIYYVNGKSVREFAFTKVYDDKINDDDSENQKSDEKNNELPPKYRLQLLKTFTNMLKPVLITEKIIANESSQMNHCAFVVSTKEFEISSDAVSIFKCCQNILSRERDGLFRYETDGIIFTPCNTGVATEHVGIAGPLKKVVWYSSFKWKPMKSNTVDFLVRVQKEKGSDADKIYTIMPDGINVAGILNTSQYKKLILHCGFDETKHGFENPMQLLLENKFNHTVNRFNRDNNDTYRPVPFRPTKPFDVDACFCNIMLDKGSYETLVMKTEEGDVFNENMIVEFRYDKNAEEGWKWIPLRVRYEKTAEFNNRQKQFGNPYHVANQIWQSIHNPIEDEMLETGDFPDYTPDEDVYYNRSGKDTNTQGLRNFHNLYIKRKLIMGVSNPTNTLIDYAVGKGGDLSKWIDAKLGFVFGVDVARDNILNHLDGACARYLVSQSKYGNAKIPKAMFAIGNSSSNIRNGDAFVTDKDKMIARAIFGEGSKDQQKLGAGLYALYGKGKPGFHVSSCQFAMHYFFKSKSTLHGFVRNLAECTMINGYFIGTCYDGEYVFNLLRTKPLNEGITILKNHHKIFEITKMYEDEVMLDDETSLGYGINVYQESINKTFLEYLVNFKYFTKVMIDYGFNLISDDDAVKMGLPNATGRFNEMYSQLEMETQLKINSKMTSSRKQKNEYGDALLMTNEEKRISFMNRYFVFQKNNDRSKHISEFNKSEFNKEESKNTDATNDDEDVLTPIKKSNRKPNKEQSSEKLEDTLEEGEIREESKDKDRKVAKPIPFKIKNKFILQKFKPVQDNEDAV